MNGGRIPDPRQAVLRLCALFRTDGRFGIPVTLLTRWFSSADSACIQQRVEATSLCIEDSWSGKEKQNGRDSFHQGAESQN